MIIYLQYGGIPHKAMVDWDNPSRVEMCHKFLDGVLNIQRFSNVYLEKVADQRLTSGDDFWDWLPER